MDHNQRNIVARGGPLRSTGQTAPGQVSVLTGGQSNAGILYDVEDGGVLLAEALWYEGAWPDPTHFKLDSSGSLTVANLMLAVPMDPAIPLVRVHGHRGAFNILTTLFNSQWGTGASLRMDIDGDGTNTKVLALANVFWDTSTTPLTVGDVFRDTSSPAAQAALFSVQSKRERCALWVRPAPQHDQQGGQHGRKRCGHSRGTQGLARGAHRAAQCPPAQRDGREDLPRHRHSRQRQDGRGDPAFR